MIAMTPAPSIAIGIKGHSELIG